MLNRLGRRETVAICLCFGGASLLGSTSLKLDEDCITRGPECPLFLARLILGIFGKMNFCITLSSVYILALELFPSCCRGTGLGISCVSARIGTFLAPYIVLTGTVSPQLPVVVFGIVSIVAGVFTMMLPDTTGRRRKGKRVARAVAPLAATCPMTAVTSVEDMSYHGITIRWGFVHPDLCLVGRTCACAGVLHDVLVPCVLGIVVCAGVRHGCGCRGLVL